MRLVPHDQPLQIHFGIDSVSGFVENSEFTSCNCQFLQRHERYGYYNTFTLRRAYDLLASVHYSAFE